MHVLCYFVAVAGKANQVDTLLMAFIAAYTKSWQSKLHFISKVVKALITNHRLLANMSRYPKLFLNSKNKMLYLPEKLMQCFKFYRILFVCSILAFIIYFNNANKSNKNNVVIFLFEYIIILEMESNDNYPFKKNVSYNWNGYHIRTSQYLKI